MKMIWGMTLEPGKLYTEVMGEEVQLSMAAIDSRKDLDETTNSNSFCQIVMKTNKGEYVLCTLIHGVMFQQSLDLKLMPREKVTFSVHGPSVVYLVGYTASYPEDEEELDLEDEEEEEEEEGILEEMGEDESSAWKVLDAEEQLVDQVKQEAVEIPDDDDVESVDTEEYLPEVDAEVTPEELEQPHEIEDDDDDPPKDAEEEMIFSVADLEPSEIKSEAPTPKPESPNASSQQVMVPEVSPPQEEDDLFNIQTTDEELPLPQTVANPDFFYPETQQQPDVPVTPISFQPTNAPGDFQHHNPHGDPHGVLPPPESLMPPQKTFVQRAQPSPHRRGTVQQINIQRTYPPQRRQYGTNRNQPAGKTRTLPPQPINVQQQQVRNISNIQQQSIPGTSQQQQDIPGPSTSGQLDQTLPHVLQHPAFAEQNFFSGVHPQTHLSRVHFPPHSSTVRHFTAPPSRTTTINTTSSKSLPGNKMNLKGPPFQSSAIEPSSKVTVGPEATSDTPHQISVAFSVVFCKYCGKKFADEAKYRRHEKYHTQTRCHLCTLCNKAFMSKKDLIRHERVHTGEKPFQCNVCSKLFSRNSSLRDHQILHTGERPFKCERCNASFTRKSLLRLHEKDGCRSTLKR